MKTLSSNWLTEGLMDSEFKRYILLAYLQNCREYFSQTKLFPPLAELVDHYRRLMELRQNLEALAGSFPRELKGLDLKNFKLEYGSATERDENLAVIEEILEFSIPQLREALHEGRDIYEFIEKQVEIAPVGVLPVYTSEGYLLLSEEYTRDVHVYLYQNSVISTTGDTLHSLSLNYVLKQRTSMSNTIETIKLKLLKRFTHLPNPATWLCVSKLPVPLSETFFPIAKRLLLRHITRA